MYWDKFRQRHSELQIIAKYGRDYSQRAFGKRNRDVAGRLMANARAMGL